MYDPTDDGTTHIAAWHDISELPERPGQVLCWDGETWYIAYFGYFKEPFSDGPGEPVFNGCHWATHWMPLPEPPVIHKEK